MFAVRAHLQAVSYSIHECEFDYAKEYSQIEILVIERYRIILFFFRRFFSSRKLEKSAFFYEFINWIFITFHLIGHFVQLNVWLLCDIKMYIKIYIKIYKKIKIMLLLNHTQKNII